MENEKTKLKLPIRMYICLLIVAALLCGTMFTFARYTSSASADDSVTVALFANSTSFEVPISQFYPGNELDVTFKINNHAMYGGTQRVCEVSQSYVVEAKRMTERLPLIFEWEDTATNTTSANTVSGEFLINNGVAEAASHEYVLHIRWDPNDTSSNYADEIEVIRISITATQID